jgi:signal transduction histidine kinase
MLKVFRSTSMQLALVFAALFVAASLLLAGLLWWNTTGYLDRETDAVIVADTRAIGDRLSDFGLPGAVQMMNERIAADSDQKAIYLLTDPLLRPLGGNVAAWPLKVRAAPGWYEVELVHRDRLHMTRLLHVVLPGNYQLLVGRDVQDRVDIRSLFFGSLVWAGLAMLVLALTGGWLIHRTVLSRIASINRTAQAIMQGDLKHRLPQGSSEDEFGQLSMTINGMLDQIEQLVDGVREVSNAIAHDLRTPLAEARARLEDLLRRPERPESMQDGIAASLADIDRLIGVFNALLRLAEIDSGSRRAGFETIDLVALIDDAGDLYGPVAEARGLGFSCAAEAGLTAHGDRLLLTQAISNLLDNAVKYTPPGGRISLQAARGPGGGIVMTVADTGPGIPEADVDRVRQRFYRGDASRHAAGSGLGLSLVNAVARLHGGDLRLEGNNPGLRASLALPPPA